MSRIESDMLSSAINKCVEDICGIKNGEHLCLEQQIRAYDLLDVLLSVVDGPGICKTDAVVDAAARFCAEYEKVGAVHVDENALKAEAKTRLEQLEKDLNEKRFEAAAAASLHEFAKEVFDIWQTSGIFARRRALRELRERAGFRLESHRIGNYVAKTFDLMNEAKARFAKAQQAVFSNDMSYKVQAGTYEKIYNILREE